MFRFSSSLMEGPFLRQSNACSDSSAMTPLKAAVRWCVCVCACVCVCVCVCMCVLCFSGLCEGCDVLLCEEFVMCFSGLCEECVLCFSGLCEECVSLVSVKSV